MRIHSSYIKKIKIMQAPKSLAVCVSSAHVHTASKFYENTQASSYIENRCRCSTVAAYMQVTIVPSRACKCAIWPEFTIIYTRVRLVNNG